MVKKLKTKNINKMNLEELNTIDKSNLDADEKKELHRLIEEVKSRERKEFVTDLKHRRIKSTNRPISSGRFVLIYTSVEELPNICDDWDKKGFEFLQFIVAHDKSYVFLKKKDKKTIKKDKIVDEKNKKKDEEPVKNS